MALKGLRVLELAGLAPGPFCGMILADYGAKVIRVDRLAGMDQDRLCRGKLSIALDLRNPDGRKVLRKLCANADVLIEPFRPGIMEKLELGPAILMADNPRLIYARLTGYGQQGEMSHKAGHDINYLATSGVLSMLGRSHEKPFFPINLLADFAGGGLMCAFGILLALQHRHQTGQGQVIDNAMVHGAAYTGSFLWMTEHETLLWSKDRGQNILDGGAPFYDTYETKDGKYMSVGAIEPQFYADLIKGLGLSEHEAPQIGDWEAIGHKFCQVFKTKTRAEWVAVFDSLDACVAPVLTKSEASHSAHNRTNSYFLSKPDGYWEPAPAPKLSAGGGIVEAGTTPVRGQHTYEVLREAGWTQMELDKLSASGAIMQAQQSHSKM